MKMSEGVEWTAHACVLLAALPPRVGLPANALAEFHALAPAYMAKHMQALTRAGVVEFCPWTARRLSPRTTGEPDFALGYRRSHRGGCAHVSLRRDPPGWSLRQRAGGLPQAVRNSRRLQQS